MRTTLVSLSSAYLLLSQTGLVSAAVAQLKDVRRRDLVCTDDSFYMGVWDNPEIYTAVTQECSEVLGYKDFTSCIAYKTPVTTVYPATEITGTTTVTVTSPSSTVTVTGTATVLGLKAKRDREAVIRAAVTQAAEFKPLARRQDTTSSVGAPFDIGPGLTSACQCNTDFTAQTDIVTCTASTSTKTEQVITYAEDTVEITATSGVTTVTTTVNATVTIVTTASTTSGTGSTWVVPTTNSLSESYWSASKSKTKTHKTSTTISTSSLSDNTSWSPTVNPESTTSSPESTSSVTMTTAPSENTSTSSMTMTTTSGTVSPSGCPGINGTVFVSSNDPCESYLRLCGVSYKSKDFYNEDYYYDSPDDCTAVCDHSIAGTQCLGIVWNTTASDGSTNCQQLKSLSNPVSDAAAIALIRVPNPACQSTTSTSMMTTSGSMTVGPVSTKSITTWDHTWNHTRTGSWGSYNETWTNSGENRNGTWSNTWSTATSSNPASSQSTTSITTSKTKKHKTTMTTASPYNTTSSMNASMQTTTSTHTKTKKPKTTTAPSNITATWNATWTAPISTTTFSNSSTVGPISTSSNSSCPVLTSTLFLSNASTVTSVQTVYATNFTTVTLTETDSTTTTTTDLVTTGVNFTATITESFTITVTKPARVERSTTSKKGHKGWSGW